MSAYVVHEELVAGVPSGNQLTVTFPDPIEVGDTLVLMIGGGNQVPSAPSGWTTQDFRTGQEAQGRVLSVVTQNPHPDGLVVTLNFDGNDRCGVGLVHVRGECGVDLVFAERVGSVGASYGGYGVGTGLPGTSLTYLFSFQRNSSGNYATVDDAVEVDALSNGAEGTSLYRVSPSGPTTATWTLTAGRSGHYLAAVEIYSFVRTSWQHDAEKIWTSTASTEDGFQVVGTRPEQIPFNDTVTDAADDLFDGWVVEFPTGLPYGSRIEYSFVNLAGADNDGWQGLWSIRAINLERLTSVVSFEGSTGAPPEDVQNPETGELADPDAVGIEWNPVLGAPLRQKVTATISHLNTLLTPSTIPNADREFVVYVLMSGAGGGVFPTTYLSPSVIGQTFAYVGTFRWADVHPDDDPVNHPVTIENIIPGNASGPVRAIVVAVDPASLDEQPIGSGGDGLVMDYSGATLQQEYQPSYRLLYRGLVTVGPPEELLYLRRHPADGTVSAWGSQGRNFPRSRRRRNFGQQP